MPRAILFLAGWLAACMCLAGCEGGKPNAGKDKWPQRPPAGSQVEAVPAAPPTAEPKTIEDFRAREERLKNERDSLKDQLATKEQEIETAAKRTKEKEQSDALAARMREATIGRWIAGICFAASVALTIASFIPGWGALIPKWAGPLGMGAGVLILVAAEVWVWVALHVVQLAIGSAAIGALVLICVLRNGAKQSLLLNIRQKYHDLMEDASDDEAELNIKADTLEAEIKAGVHHIGQNLRGKPLKTMADVMKLRIAANDAKRK